MPDAVVVKVEDKELRKLFGTMQKKSIDARPLMALFYGKVNFEVQKNFRLQSATSDIFKGPPSNSRKKWTKDTSYTIASRLAKRSSTSRAGAILQESGQLRGSMGTVRVITRNKMEYGTFSGISAVHHFGTIIRPKKAKFLALPYPGVTGRPRQYENTFFKGKTLYQNVEGGIKPLFFLKKQVTIPARPHMTVPESLLKTLRVMSFAFLTGKINFGTVQ